MEINRNNWEDVKKYYEKTWVKFPRLSQDQLWHIDRVNPDFCEVSSTNGDEALIDMNKGYEMDFVLPKRTIFQHGDKAVMLSRIPARMWKKGISKANTSFAILSTNGWTAGEFDPSLIEGFINKPSYFGVKEIIAEYTKPNPEKLSMAFSPRFAVNAKGGVYIDTVLVGRLQFLKAGPVLTVKKIFAPDLFSYFYNYCQIKSL
jgi:hypothetical protein